MRMPLKLKRPTCILLLGKNKSLNKSAQKYATGLFSVLAVLNTHNDVLDEKKLASLKPDFVFNFLGNKILKGSLLKFKVINFHPAPPEWAGRGGASLALYSGAKTYGATAHLITRVIDGGPILKVKRFKICKNESCEQLFERGERASLDLFRDILLFIAREGKIPSPSGAKWTKKATTHSEFEKWLIMDPKNKTDFIKKIEATRHPDFPGPYVVIHGYKFKLIS